MAEALVLQPWHSGSGGPMTLMIELKVISSVKASVAYSHLLPACCEVCQTMTAAKMALPWASRSG